MRKLQVLRGFQASNELPSGADVDESPGSILFVHGIFVGLAHEPERANLRFGEVIQRSRKVAHLAVIELHATGVLLPAPDHLFFFFAFAFRQDVRRDRYRGNEQERDEEDDHEQGVSTLAAFRCRSWALGVHAEGGAPCSSRAAVPWSPEETSS